MFKLPEYGYTPENYKALVKLTGLSNAAFCREFNINEQTFYKHANGSRSMQWYKWELLQKAVFQYAESNLTK